MTFSHPEFLAAAPVVMLLLLWSLLARRRRLRRLADAYGDTAIDRLVPADVRRFPVGRLACLLIAGLAICLAASSPGVTQNRGPNGAAPLDIAIAVDVSISMSASDIAPTRIQRARDLVIRVAKEVPKARLSLVLFGDWPYTLVPPTDDPGVAAYFAQSLTGALLSNLASSIRTSSGDRGLSLQAALAHARSTLDARSTGGATKVILVVSDGAVPDNPEELTRSVTAAAGRDAVVWTAGVGTWRGAKLEMNGRPLLDAAGNPGVAGFEETLLRAVAQAGGGNYEDVSSDRGQRALVSGLRRMAGVASPEDVVPGRVTFWLLLLAVVLLLSEGGLDVGKRLMPGLSKRSAA